MKNNMKAPSWWRRMWTKIVNKLLRRKCGSCRHWQDYHRFGEGSCRRWPFFTLSEEYSWKNACENYEGMSSK